MYRKLLIVAASVVVMVTTARAQEAIGPAPPRPAAGMESLETTLQGLMKTSAAGNLWRDADAAALSGFVQQIDNLRVTIDGIRIGPVDPKPKPKPVGTRPPTGPKPSRLSLETSLRRLLDTLHDARAKDPTMTLPADNAPTLEGIVQALSEGQLG